MLNHLFERFGQLALGRAPTGALLDRLEDRRQLAADLQVTIGQVSVRHDFRLRTDMIRVPVTVTNVGSVFEGTFRVRMLLSSDAQVGNDYTYFSRTFTTRLGGGQPAWLDMTAPMPVDPLGVRGERSLPAGAYRVRAVVSPVSPATDASSANDNAFSSGTVNIAYRFGVDPVDGKRRDLHVPVNAFQTLGFTLDGGGSGTLGLASDRLVSTIVGSNRFSTFRIYNSFGRVPVTIGRISVTGALKELVGPGVIVNGDLAVSQAMRQVTLGGLSNASWTIGGSMPLDASITSVSNVSLNSTGSINRLDVGQWITTDGSSDAIVCRDVGILLSKGDFSPSVSVTGDVKRIAVGGAVNSHWDVSGSVTSFRVGSTGTDFALTAGDQVSLFNVDGNMQGRLNAPTIGPVVVGGSLISASILAGTNLGTDGDIGGTGTAADRFTAGSLASLLVKGAATTSLVTCSLNHVDGTFFNGNDRFASASSRIGTIRIAGTTFNTKFAAKSFSGPITITDLRLNAAEDGRFFSDFPIGG